MFENYTKGQIGQLLVELEAAKKGLVVSRPTTETRYDLIIEDSGKLYRVQVKYADTAPDDDSSVIIKLYKETRNNGNVKTYNADEVDLVLAYIPKVDKIVCLKPEVFTGKTSVTLRILPAKNGQTKGIRLIEDYIWY